MAHIGEESTVAIALPRSVCDSLAKAFPYCPIDDEAEAANLERMVVALLEETQRARRNAGGQTLSKAGERSRVPEIHGGPEGAYEREADTGRWRSVSCTRRSTPSVADVTSNEDKENRGSQHLSNNILPDGNAVDDSKTDAKPTCPEFQDNSPNQSEELATACATAKRSRAETAKLWDAAEAVLTEPEVLAEMRRRDTLSRALAEADFETQRRASTWDMMRSSMDVKTFAEVTRKADASDDAKGDRNISICAARRIFDAPSGLERPEQSAANAPPKKRLDGSRRPMSRGGVDRTSGREQAPTTSILRSSSRSFLLPPRSKASECEREGTSARVSLPATFGALQAAKIGACFGKPTAAEGGAAANRHQSPSVRSLVQALDGAHGGA